MSGGAVARIGIDTVEGAKIIGTQNSTVSIDGGLVALVGDSVASHGKSPHNSATLIEGSPTFSINNIPVVRIGDRASCNHLVIKGDATVGFVVDESTGSGMTDSVPSSVTSEYPQFAGMTMAAAIVSVEDDTTIDSSHPLGALMNNSRYGGDDRSATGTYASLQSNANTTVIVGNTSDLVNVTAWDSSLQLSPNVTLGKVCNTIASPNQSIAKASIVSGLSESQIVQNLRNLSLNVIEPFISQYPNTRINSCLRDRNTTATISQHVKGQAVDLVVTNITDEQLLFEIAQWVQRNMNYDQFIYETQGGMDIWFHLSWNGESNRKQVLTKPCGSKYYSGLMKIIRGT